MTPQWVRDRLAVAALAPRGDHDLTPDIRAKLPADRPLVPAAVLVPLVLRSRGLSVLFTQRTETLAKHAGQISFPGGRIDPTDAHPEAAALREAQEEIGLDPGFVDVAGRLARYETGTGYAITPVVGFVREGFSIVPEPAEVADVFEVPLTALVDRTNHQRHSREWQGLMRHYYVIPYEGRAIWGATAGMVVNLTDVLLGIEG
jgi:8-oxo-dGTP pyrophosphatase MutT (NUDIX family)